MWSGQRSIFSSRRARARWGFALTGALAGLVACGGKSTVIDDVDEASAATGGRSGAGAGGARAGTGTGAVGGSGTSDTPYEDPGCPDTPPPDAVVECGVFDQVSACAPGLACKPTVLHPYGSGCDQQTLDFLCVNPGSGQQGDACDDGFTDCADGFICVVGAAHGAHCLRMCPLDGARHCPSGYVCGPTDVEGVGVCA